MEKVILKVGCWVQLGGLTKIFGFSEAFAAENAQADAVASAS